MAKAMYWDTLFNGLVPVRIVTEDIPTNDWPLADAAGIARCKEWRDVGVNVWTSADLSCAGRMMYTKGDVDGKPHWSMELVEHIAPSDLEDCVRLVRLDTENVAKPSRAERAAAAKDGWTYRYDRRYGWERQREVSIPW